MNRIIHRKYSPLIYAIDSKILIFDLYLIYIVIVFEMLRSSYAVKNLNLLQAVRAIRRDVK